MEIMLAPEDFRPVVEQVVAEALARLGEHATPARLCFTEVEAARMIGMNKWQLRDERRRGRITGSVGPARRVYYTKADLERYLASRRTVATTK
jgi:hypothetical protein